MWRRCGWRTRLALSKLFHLLEKRCISPRTACATSYQYGSGFLRAARVYNAGDDLIFLTNAVVE